MRGGHHIFEKMVAGHCTRQTRANPRPNPKAIGPNQPWVRDSLFVSHTSCHNLFIEYQVCGKLYCQVYCCIFSPHGFLKLGVHRRPSPLPNVIIVTARGVGSCGENVGGV